MSLRDAVRLLRRSKWIILGAMALGTVLGILYLRSVTPLYTSTAKILIENRRTGLLGRDTGGSAPLDVAEVETHIEMLRSEAVALAVARRVRENRLKGHAERPSEPSVFGVAAQQAVAWARWLVLGSAPPEVTPTDADRLRDEAAALQAGLNVRRVGYAYAIDVSYTSPDRYAAAELANAFVDEYIAAQKAGRLELTRNLSAWMDERASALRAQAEEAALAAQTFRAENNIVAAGSRGLITDQQLSELNSQLLTARAKTAEAVAKLDRIREVIASGATDMTIGEALDSGIITTLRQRYLEVTKQASEIAARNGADHPAVASLTSEGQSLQRAIREELQRIAQVMESDVEIARRREDELAGMLREVVQQANATDAARVRLRQLESAAQTLQTAYEGFLQRYTDTVQQQTAPVSEARIVSQAAPAPSPSFPRKRVVLALAPLIGAGLGMAFSILRQMLDTSIRSPADIVGFGSRCLGQVPSWNSRKGRRSSLEALSAREALQAVAVRSDAPFAEAVRNVKLNLQLAGAGHTIHCIGIVSALPGEGKSTLTSNLAHLFAMSSVPTLVIDGDWRRPRLSQTYAPGAQRGLVEVLLGQAEFAEAIVTEEASGLSLLPMAEAAKPKNPELLFSSERMARVLAAARRRFRMILIDLPPAGVFTDAKAMLHELDAVVVVAEWGVTAQEAVAAIVQDLSVEEDKVLGVILNKAPVQSEVQGNLYLDYAQMVR